MNAAKPHNGCAVLRKYNVGKQNNLRGNEMASDSKSETDPILARLMALERGLQFEPCRVRCTGQELVECGDCTIDLRLRQILADVAVEYHLGEPYLEWRMSLARDLIEIGTRFGFGVTEQPGEAKP